MCLISCWETGICPSGSVTFVLSTYIGLYNTIRQIVMVVLYTLYSATEPVSREDEPWCSCSVHLHEMVIEESPLCWSAPVIMFSTHHHHMDTAIVKPIPYLTMDFFFLYASKCDKSLNSPRLIWSRPWHGKAINVGNIALSTRVMTLIEGTTQSCRCPE